MDQKEAVLRRIKAQFDQHKRDIYMYYAELKLKLPTYLKALTLKEFEEAGGTIDPDLTVPRKAAIYLKEHADSTRKKENLLERFNEIHEQHRNQVTTYYRNIKQKLPPEFLSKKMGELEDTDWIHLGVDPVNFPQIK